MGKTYVIPAPHSEFKGAAKGAALEVGIGLGSLAVGAAATHLYHKMHHPKITPPQHSFHESANYHRNGQGPH